jgi:hypothetical protein
MTDARVEAFLVDILALEGANPDAIRGGVSSGGLSRFSGPFSLGDFVTGLRQHPH